MKRIIFVIGIIFTTPVFAQQAPVEVQSVSDDWMMIVGSQKHFAESVQKLITAYQSLLVENTKLKADLATSAKPKE